MIEIDLEIDTERDPEILDCMTKDSQTSLRVSDLVPYILNHNHKLFREHYVSICSILRLYRLININ